MSHDLIILIALAAPVLAMFFLRINGAMVFLSLCLGAVLVNSVASEANAMLGLFVPKAGSVSATTVQLILLLAPAVLTGVLTLFSVHGRLKVMLNLLPAAAASALAVLLAAPLLPLEAKQAFGDPTAWKLLAKSEALIVGVGALMSLTFLWTQRRLFSHQDKKKH
jgi:hypothetical protein